MNLNQQLISRFYTAFQQLDYNTMQECYHADAIFFDPVFHDLNAYELKYMWEMLCKQAKNFELRFSDVDADEEYGSCNWTATYTFSKSANKVVNNVKSHFKFRDGKIIEQTDDFDLWKWSRQALGVPGWILGWSEFIQKKVRNTAQDKLLEFMNKQATAAHS